MLKAGYGAARVAAVALWVSVQTAGLLAQTDPATQLRQQVVSQGLLVWSLQRPIQWSDFQGQPPMGGEGAAQTASSFTYHVECHDSAPAIVVMATFWPAQSWARPDIARRTPQGVRTLLHERGHFNISELFARRFHRAASETAGLCPGRTDSLAGLFDEQNRANTAMQDRYDRETVHGSDQEAQARWDAMIRASLDSLAHFGDDR